MKLNMQNKISEFIKMFDYSFTGVGLWAAYFFFKFGLVYLSYIDFSIPLNLLLFVCFCVSFKNKKINISYKSILAILAIMLLYHDSYLPKIGQILNQTENITGFSFSYIMNFILDFINANMILALLALIFISYVISSWIRLTSLVTLGFIFCIFSSVSISKLNNFTQNNSEMCSQFDDPIKSSIAETNENDFSNSSIEAYLDKFYQIEKNRIVPMPSKMDPNYTPFDIVILNICSLATDDLDAENQLNHPLFNQFNINFKNFNSAASYSTPASLHLLRANCGLETESEIFRARRPECEILTSLENLGYQVSLFMDHDGEYGNYISHLKNEAGLEKQLVNLENIGVQYRSFDGSPIYSDSELFNLYINTIAKQTSTNNVTFFNLISLHDGNRLPNQNQTLNYGIRLKKLLDDINEFITNIKKEKKKTLFVIVPEHGAAIRGDRMQISKLREIPTEKITKIPVYIGFFNSDNENIKAEQVKINTPHSYMALSEIIKRSLEFNLFSNFNETNLAKISDELPVTQNVSESTNAFFMLYKNKPYYKLKGDEWAPYIY